MLSKNEVKYIQSLCHKKQRDEDKVFVAEGPKLATEMLRSDFKILKIYAVVEWIEKHPAVNADVIEITHDELERISNVQTPNQVLILAKQKVLTSEPVLKNSITLVLDAIQDPGNMGTIIRIADWFGVKQIVAGVDSVDVYNPKVVQASMGSICRVNVWCKVLADWMSQLTIPVYGALLNGQSIYEIEKIKEGLLLIGNEGNGIKSELLSYISNPVTIPKFGEAESLNAAVATGIILSHIRLKS